MGRAWKSWGPRWLAMTAVAVATAAMTTTTRSAPADGRPGYRPAAYAITGAKLVTVPGPGGTIDGGTVVVRDGVIEAVGLAAKVAVPFDAEVLDGKGLVVYPGFIDGYTTLGTPAGAVRSQTGPGRSAAVGDYPLPRTPTDNRLGLTPEFQVAAALDLAEAAATERRALGFADLLAAPGGSIAAGQGALVSLSGQPRREAIVKSPVALHVNLQPPGEVAPPHDHDDAAPRDRPRRGPAAYPTSLMGSIAHLRQAMLDAEHDQEMRTYFDKYGGPRPPFDPALQALQDARTRRLPVWWEANTRDEIHRALDLAEEFGTTAVIVGGREAWRVADRLKAGDVPVILRVDFPDEPKVPDEAEYRKRTAEARDAPLKVLKDRHERWAERVGNARVLAAAGVRFAFASDGLARADAFHAQVRRAIAAGLPREAALDALTRRVAEIAGLGDRLGTIEPGKLGHLVALSAPYGDEAAKVRYVLADGLKFEPEKATPEDVKQPETRPETPKADTPKPKDEPRPEPPKAKTEAPKADTLKPEPPKADPPKAEPAAPKPAAAPTPPRNEEDQPPKSTFSDLATEFDEDRKPTIATGGSCFIKGATILTVANGTIPRGSLLILDGKIADIGPELPDPPKGVTVIDGTGLVVMPGIIDTHSHMAIQGGVNEMSLSIVPEVRVRDVVAAEDPTIYRALAGGVTTARLLHGSADTIGGQDAVIKLRHGRPARELLLTGPDVPRGVKFALGENVTRRSGRFPNTRMGVEATIERAFEEAAAYKAEWAAFTAARAKGKAGPSPRRDLRLEALADVLDGSLRVHCHCYRLDEMLMLLRLADRHGVQIRSLQHALDGYKIAAEIARHGAGVSTFSDWWAYKVEAFDAIPYNAALLAEAGVQVSIKSDDEELVRHLYLEAAKVVKYGGGSEARALEMITLNPARQLGLDKRIGSIEIGKEADLAIFNGHPFDAFARCQMTLVDGEVRFQRREAGKDVARPADHAAMPGPAPDAPIGPLVIPDDPRGIFAVTGATIHPVAGPAIADGILVIVEGKIAALGGPDTRIPTGARMVDAKGLDAWPGLIDAGSVLGLFEVGSLAETQDYADSAQFQPELRAASALRPDSELIPVTRANGVLAALVQPSGGLIAGQACVINLDGWVPSELVLAEAAALVVNIPPYLPANPDTPRPRGGDDPNAKRKERLDAIREQFRLALEYDRVARGARERKDAAAPADPRLAALVPYARGEKPVLLRANLRVEILDALTLAEELKLKGVITGGLDAWKVADRLKAAKVPVLISGTLRLPGEVTDPYDAPYANPARLFEAGVPFAIRAGGGGPDQATAGRNLPYEAATAVAYGLPEAEAIKAVTLRPAEILGLGDQLGSLEPGKRANVVLTAGHILQPTTEVRALFIGGHPVPPESRHTRLYAKYRGRLDDVRRGVAPMGTDPGPKPAAASAVPSR